MPAFCNLMVTGDLSAGGGTVEVDQRRHRRLTLASGEEIHTEEVVTVEDVTSEEEDEHDEWSTILRGNTHLCRRRSESDDQSWLQTSKFWASDDDKEDDDASLVIAGNNKDQPMTTHSHAVKVSQSSLSSSDFNYPSVNKNSSVMASEGTTKNLMKPWQGPLPRPRISPPKTLGDAVIKNYVERVRGG
jgi:hypothetical protein